MTKVQNLRGDDKMPTQCSEWCIPSNRGRKRVNFGTLAFHQAIEHIEYTVDLTGECWYRPGLIAKPPTYDTLVDDFRFNILSVIVPVSACQDLLNAFDKWLDSLVPFTRTLSSTPDQVVIFSLSEREGLVTDQHHPVFTFCYEAGGCRLEVFFVVDQSCVRIARDGLATVLRSLEEMRNALGNVGGV